MTLAIIGSRGVSEDYYDKFAELVPVNCTSIVSGGATGIDALARRYAAEQGLECTEILPDYAAHGRRAPLVRNDEIIARADFVVAFWDGESHGTAYTIARCVEKGIAVKVVMTISNEQ